MADFFAVLQEAFGAQVVDVRDALLTNGRYGGRLTSSIKRVVVHHSAVEPEVTWAQIAQYHVKSKGWPGIGYHLGITPDGGLSYTGSIETIRYHAGNANPDSIGVCCAGNYMTAEPTSAMLTTFSKLTGVIEDYLERRMQVVGHRDVGQTACPGANLYAALFAKEPLPNDEPVASVEKLRWWLEEYARQLEADHTERSTEILYSLIALANRVERG